MVTKFINNIKISLTRLGLFLHRNFAVKSQISRKTNISETRLSLLSNDAKTRIYAEEFYLVALAIDADLDIMASEIFQDFKLIPLKEESNIDGGEIKKLTKFGEFLNPKLNSQALISKRTGISKARISSLSNDLTAGLLGEELYLFSLALNLSPSKVWKELYEHLLLK
jgi:transcriptional regulator with XRE-family HTH domain